MSLHEYVMSKEIAKEDYPFYALIMAAMRQADSHNIHMLDRAFPEVYIEMKERYNAPGGVFNDEEREWLEKWRTNNASS